MKLICLSKFLLIGVNTYYRHRSHRCITQRGSKMKLHFKKGAIVRFVLKCEANIDACGKVIEVNENEVVFLQQMYVSQEEYQSNWGTTELSKKVSVNSYPEMHLDRSLIAMWYYAEVPSTKSTTYYGVYNPSDITGLEKSEHDKYINEYGDDDLCRGSGEYFE